MSEDFQDPRRAEHLTRATRAAQTLSETLWEALLQELSDPRGQRVTELSEQLGEVVAIVASLVRVEVRGREEPAEPVKPESRVARATTYGKPFSVQPAPPREPPETQASPSPAVLIDELAPTAAESHAQSGPQIEIRDVRREEGPSAWTGSIGRWLERYERDAAPFAVLLVELVDIERLRHAEPAEEMSRMTSLLEDALARGLRPADSLTRERPGRYWLLVPQTDQTGAQLLAERITRAVRSSASHRGTPLEIAVGMAVCPDHGRQASELAAHADVGLYAARRESRMGARSR